MFDSLICKELRRLKGAPSTANSASSIRFNPDSGASDHITCNKSNIILYSSVNSSRPIEVANGHRVFASKIGNLSSPVLPLKNVLLCNEITQNLLSISKLAETGLSTLFTNDGVYIGHIPKPKNSLISGSKIGNQYSIDIPVASSVNTVTSPASLHEWHLRLNHLHYAAIIDMAKSGSLPGLDISNLDKNNLPTCESCLIGKARHGSLLIGEKTPLPERPGEQVHIDICGPIEPISHRGFRYVLLITDKFSRSSFDYPLRSKSEASECFIDFDKKLYNQRGYHVSLLRADNEFRTNKLAAYSKEHGITQQYIVPYESQQHGLAERMNLTLFNPVRAILYETELLKKYWCELVATTIYTRNRSVNSHNKSITPWELWSNTKPAGNYLRAVGSICYSYITLPYRQQTGFTKLSDRATKCRFLGYSTDSKSYRLLRLSDSTLIIAAYENVVFPNHTPTSPPPATTSSLPDCWTTIHLDPTHQDLQTSPPSLPPNNNSSVLSDESALSEDYKSCDDDDSSFQATENTTNDEPSPIIHRGSGIWKKYKYASDSTAPSKSKHTAPTEPKRPRKPPGSYAQITLSNSPSATTEFLPIINLINSGSTQWYRCESPATALSSTTDTLPKSYNDIVNSEAPDEWFKACDSEIAAMVANNTWELVEPPPDQPIIPCKWVFRIKRNDDGTIIKYKSRLCACGNHQTDGVDYDATYSPVARPESFRLLLVTVAARKMFM